MPNKLKVGFVGLRRGSGLVRSLAECEQLVNAVHKSGRDYP